MSLGCRSFRIPVIVAMAMLPVAGHAQDVISGKFYRLAIVGRPGLGEVTNVLAFGPSINDQGQVAFVARGAISNSVFASSLGVSAPQKIVDGNAFSFLGGIQISNSGDLIALDASASVDPQGFRQNHLRVWETSPPFTNVLVAAARSPLGNDFRRINFPAALNAAGQVVYSGDRYITATTVTPALATGVRPAINRVDLPAPMEPMIAADGTVVVRTGTSPNEAIRTYTYPLSLQTEIAGPTFGFTTVGRSPSVSDNGDIIVFYGRHSVDGEGIYASLRVGAGRQIVKIAGRNVETPNEGGNDDGVCDTGETCELGELGFDIDHNPLYFASFDADARIGLTHMPQGVSGLADDTFVVSFLAIPNTRSGVPAIFSAQRGLWTVRVDMRQVGANLVEKPSMPQPVIQVGDRIGNRVVFSIVVYDPLAAATTDDLGAARSQRPGDHRIAFTALTDVDTIVVRGSHLDSDDDGLLDHWEMSGIDFNQDGDPDHLLSNNPLHKDIYVEIDYLEDASHSHRPLDASLGALEFAFNNAPVPNPNSTTGILLHLELDDLITESFSLRTLRFKDRELGPENDFDDIKLGSDTSPPTPCDTSLHAGHFGRAADRTSDNCLNVLGARRLTHHYVLFGHAVEGSPNTTGRAEIVGNDMIITLDKFVNAPELIGLGISGCLRGETRASCARRELEPSVFMHEFGHNLGLRHGGNENANCKPNYLSVMSYTLALPLADPRRPLDYSSAVLPSLNENSLSEPAGLVGPAARPALFGAFDYAPAAGYLYRQRNVPLDFNIDSDTGDTGVPSDINRIIEFPCQSPSEVGRTILTGFNDWAALAYRFRSDARSFTEGLRFVGTPDLPNGDLAEISTDLLVNVSAVADPDEDGVVTASDNCPDVANPGQADTDGDLYGDACDPGSTALPTVSITSPANGAQFPAGADITINATAADSDGSIRKVQFFHEGSFIGQDMTAPYTFVWPDVVPGQYALTAVAIDNENASTTSAVVGIVVHGADLAVTVTDNGGPVTCGDMLQYTITVTNRGPDVADGAIVTDDFPSSLGGVTWLCTPAGGATCPGSGSGSINATVNLPAGGTATFVATGTVIAGTAAILNTATVTAPAGVADLSRNNNTATRTTIADPNCSSYYTVTPCRLLDTRGPTGPSGGPRLAANATRSFPVTGLCGVPADAKAVAVILTAVAPTESGNLRLFPAGLALPTSSAINYAANRTRANNGIFALGTNGQISVRCDMAPGSTGGTHFVLDVAGYFK